MSISFADKKVIIAGSRSLNDYLWMDHWLYKITQDGQIKFEVVSGMAKGIDSMAVEWAKRNGYSWKEFPADWSLGKGAGYIRNKQMAEYADLLIAFWDGKSKGTLNMINTMKSLGKHGKVITWVNQTPPF